jgi:F-type H+-transporting ATPase subunit delta
MTNQTTFSIEFTYADALFDLAKINCKESQILKDVDKLLDLLEDIETLKDYLGSPRVNSKIKKDFIKQFMCPSNIFNEFTIGFLLILVDRGRMDLLEDILLSYIYLNDYHNYKFVAEIKTVIPLSNKQQNVIKSILKALYGAKSVELIMECDINILGGMILDCQSEVIDISVTGQLKNILKYLGHSVEFNI